MIISKIKKSEIGKISKKNKIKNSSSINLEKSRKSIKISKRRQESCIRKRNKLNKWLNHQTNTLSYKRQKQKGSSKLLKNKLSLTSSIETENMLSSRFGIKINSLNSYLSLLHWASESKAESS